MPVKPFIQARSPGYADLVNRLHDEWIEPNSALQEPVILEEKSREGRLVHVYVVWSDWGELDGVERSEIIMDAAAKKFPEPQLLDISIAMGLTPEEARRMGLQY